MTTKVIYPRDTWEWSGNAGHCIIGDFCRYHLATKVGPWWISTIGEWIPAQEIREHGENARVAHEIGCRRLYETMVFAVKICNCGRPMCDGLSMSSDCREHDMSPANTAMEARANHFEMCEKYSRIAEVPVPEAEES